MTAILRESSAPLGHAVYRCVSCHSAGLRAGAGGFDCPGCGRAYPVYAGVPLLAAEFDAGPSGYALPVDLADKICGQIGITADADARARLADILGRQYRIGGFQQSAENNYFLNRVIVDEAGKRKPLRAAFADRPVNAAVSYTIDLHYVPPVLTAGELTSYNVRLTNTGESVISSAAQPPVFLSYLWHRAGDGGLEAEGLRMRLPIDLLPGRSLSVPLQIQVPHTPGRYELELLLVHEYVAWLHAGGVRTAVTVAAEPRPRPWDAWVSTGVYHGGYDADHRAAAGVLRAAVGDPPPGTRILEVGGCCNPMTRGFPAEVFSMDIDMQTLQVGQLLAERRGDRVTYLCGDANDLPFRDGAIDWVVMFATLHHFADPAAVLASFARVLRPGGRIAAMCEPLGHYYHGQIYQAFLDELEQGINEQTFTPEEYYDMFRRAGLVVERVVVDVGSFNAILRPAPVLLTAD